MSKSDLWPVYRRIVSIATSIGNIQSWQRPEQKMALHLRDMTGVEIQDLLAEPRGPAASFRDSQVRNTRMKNLEAKVSSCWSNSVY
ncbi:hypothetical protein BT96DRAFT_915414 [Gymnopus androsaceus JB14]|uniref:Uncharacterized protein n=1 Tax=Gymnopus androsaceus JB14 TaxID=1447944 RepID=A0A6A4I7E6_9AGAR|nr:hypothetical protein BT96DRAFT_915414 [Gymnopus androsaceus JB14]